MVSLVEPLCDNFIQHTIFDHTSLSQTGLWMYKLMCLMYIIENNCKLKINPKKARGWNNDMSFLLPTSLQFIICSGILLNRHALFEAMKG
jgi:hypothetical protein